MNMYSIILASLLIGCGGPEFSGTMIPSDIATPQDDAGIEVDAGDPSTQDADDPMADGGMTFGGKPDAQSSRDAGPSPIIEASTAHDSGLLDVEPPPPPPREAAAPEPEPEAGPTCTPFPSGAAALYCNMGTLTPGAQLIMQIANGQNVTSCFVSPAPAACRCQETYTCDCLQTAKGTCPDSNPTLVSCAANGYGALGVVCR